MTEPSAKPAANLRSLTNWRPVTLELTSLSKRRAGSLMAEVSSGASLWRRKEEEKEEEEEEEGEGGNCQRQMRFTWKRREPEKEGERNGRIEGEGGREGGRRNRTRERGIK